MKPKKKTHASKKFFISLLALTLLAVVAAPLLYGRVKNMFSPSRRNPYTPPIIANWDAGPTRLPDRTSAVTQRDQPPAYRYVGKAAAGGQNGYALWRFDEFYSTAPGSIDWVFIGSSHSYCTFDPANFDAQGVNSFQLGLPRQLVDGTYFTLLEVLEYQQPDTVILELFWWVLERETDREQTETFFNVIRSEHIKDQYRREMAPHMDELDLDVWNFVGNTDEMMQISDKAPVVEHYRGRGYTFLGTVMSDAMRDEIAARPYVDMGDWQPSPRQDRFLEKIANLCAERGIRLILVTAPVSNVLYSRMKNYRVFHDYLAGFAKRRGLPYLDYILLNAEENLFCDDCFFDGGHLNGHAVGQANAHFIGWLAGL